MRSIIRQNPATAALPDFRNLGTVLRVLLAVNAIGAIAAVVVEPRWFMWSATWLDVLAYLEPCLMTELLLLYLLQPVFERVGYVAGTALILVLTVAIVLCVDAILPRALPLPPTNTLRHVLLALLLTGVILAYFHLRAKALSPAITEARLQALQARIRPHFLFNSINAVLSLVRSEPKRAETALEDMADLFRVLMRDNRELAPLSDEVELCRQYLELEKLRLGDRLRVEWHLQSMPGDALVPPLVLQPILENAVYHGIEPSSAPGVVSINIFYKNGDVHAIVRNPYRVEGGRHHAGNKMALGNVRERLALHFDAEATLASRVKADAYEVHIRMPYRSSETRRAAEQAAKTDVAAAHGTPLARSSQGARTPHLHFPTPEATRG